jgi:glucose/arabinose dehydrogenase
MTLADSRRPRAALYLALAIAACWPVYRAWAATNLPPGFQDVPVVSGLSSATAMQFAPDGRLFVAEQAGQLRVIKNGALLPTPFVNLTVNSSGERGLLGVAFDPNFATNQFVYVFYTATSPSIHNRISRFTANGDVAAPNSELVLLDFDNLSGATNHNGGAMHFGPDGKLYAAHGENANGNNAQTLTNLLGKPSRDPNKVRELREDRPHEQRRLDSNRQPVFRNGNRKEPAHLGARAA